jgi:hypothetical protein
LPGGDSPERIVFGALADVGWRGVAERVRISRSQLVDACARAMTFDNEHQWIRLCGRRVGAWWSKLVVGYVRSVGKRLSIRYAKPVIEPLQALLP